jgi:predicted ATPase/DNA-binding SARP family transcriptional activator
VQIGVLGPLEVVDGGVEVVIEGAMVRRLAVALAASGGAADVDLLVDALWGNAPPPSSRKTLQGFVHRLRRVLGPEAVLTLPHGYRLNPQCTRIDVAAFEHELAEADDLCATGHREAALAIAEAARRRWRATPFNELAAWPGVLVERARLEERFFLAEELTAELRLDLCPSDVLLGELEALVTRAPLRERRWWLLIEATRRAGRSAQALATFERARSALIDALGAEPGPALQALYRQLLDETAPILLAPPVEPSPMATLPTPRSSFVGRAEEVRHVLDRVERERLVTLVGVGGSGKTRLAIEVGHRWSARHAQPVWFADLTALSDASGLAAAVAAAASLVPGLVTAGTANLAAELAGHRGLLVLDNAEHLLAAVADLVDRILDAAPSLRVVVTSREPLHIDGECRWPVGPLSGGPAGDAVALFLARARSRRPDFAGGNGLLTDVAALCADLDGLPLAVELAAARVDVLSPTELRQRQAAHGDLPVPAPDRAHPAPRPGGRRFSSLAAALKSSTDALSADQRAAFRCLSVLPDTFGLAAAAGVCGLDDEPALTVLESLVDKSLLTSAYRAESVRFRMLDTVRRHAAAGLAASPADQADHAEARDRLLFWAAAEARHYQRLSADGRRHRVAMDLADLEQHNLRAALDWAAEGGDPADGLAVMCRTEDWWRASGHTVEAWERLQGLLDRAETEPVPGRRWLEGVTCLAVFATFLDDRAQAIASELVSRAERRLDVLPDRRLRLRLASQLAWIRVDFADSGSGERLRELLEESRRLGGLLESSILHYLAIWQLADDPVEALATAQACEVAARRNGNEISRAHAAEVHGIVLTVNRRHGAAGGYLRDALEGLTAADHFGCVLHCLESIALWAGSGGRIDEARTLLGLAVGIRRSLRRVRVSVEAFGYAAAVACCGEPTPASGGDLITDALALARHLVSGDPSCRDHVVDPAAGLSTASRPLSRPAWLQASRDLS